ncbi:MAG TPA: type II secretion system F family protein, partial [Blastocatellia bacterium]|nr:type II secretion system F family protein [Blastocatellia bacterium]
MAEYICRLGTPAGEVVTRTIEANAESDLRKKLERDGFRVFAVSSNGSAGIRASFGGESHARKIKVEDFLLFNQQLSALLRAGLPILQAIGILRKRVANERLRIVLEDVEEKVRAGQAL